MSYRKGCGKLAQSLIDRLVRRTHKVKAAKPLPELSGGIGKAVFFHLQQEKLCRREMFRERIAGAGQFRVGVPGRCHITLAVFFDPGPLNDHTLCVADDLSLKG